MRKKLVAITKGFSLIEIMIVLLVIGILSTLALVGVGKLQASARDTQRTQMLTGVQSALERYYADAKSYPKIGHSISGVSPSDACLSGTILVNSSAAFNTMMAQLQARGYLDSSEFIDPPNSPVFTGAYTAACNALTESAGWEGGGGDPCGISGAWYTQKTGGTVKYCYFTDGQSYRLGLVKESGGTIVLKSPK